MVFVSGRRILRTCVDLGRARREGVLGIDVGRERCVVDADQIQRGDRCFNGLGDYRGDPAQLHAMAQGNDAIAVLERAGLGVEYGGFNLQRAPFDDPVFRRALSLVIDRDALATEAWDGRAVKTNSMVSSALRYWHDGGLDDSAYDPDFARQILSEAGYQWIEDKLHLPDAVPEKTRPAN